MQVSSVNSNTYNASFGRIKKTKNGNEYNSTHMMKKIFGTVGAIGGASFGAITAAEGGLKGIKAVGLIAGSAVAVSILSMFPFAAIFDAVRNNSRKNRADENARMMQKIIETQNQK